MIVLGMWVAFVGYGIAYAGWRTLAGDSCGLVDAFRGTCGKQQGVGTGGRGGRGITRAGARRQLHGQQISWLAQQRVISQHAGVP